MTERRLPPEEWHRLHGTPLEPLVPAMDPAKWRVVVVEDQNGCIIGTWAAMRNVLAEGLWIDPAHRGMAGVGRRLMKAMQRECFVMGAREFCTVTTSDDVRRMAEKLGASRVDGTLYVIGTGA